MTYLSLRDFLDVAGKNGKPRVTKVRQIKHAEEYSPGIDFYKPLREGIVRIHKTGKSRASLSGILLGINHKLKLHNYPLAIKGYDTWWGTHQLKWFEPPKGKYSKYGFEIGINPELGLEIDGAAHVIKLYLSNPPLSPLSSHLTGTLMTHILGAFVPAASLGALDVRRSMLVAAPMNAAAMMTTVDSVLADIAAIWPTV